MLIDVLVLDDWSKASHDDGGDLVDKKIDILQLTRSRLTMLSLI